MMSDNKSREEILEKRCSDYEDEIDEHIQKIIELEKNIDDLKSERQQWNNEVSSLFKRVNRLEKKNDDYIKIILLQLDLLKELTNNLKGWNDE